jgi:hypothetical protein
MVEPTKALFKENMPEVRLINIVDDSLIQDVIKAGKVTAAVKKRLVGYYFAAVDAGADIILNTCSSVGEIAEAAKDLMGIPIVRIDEAMVTRAVEISDSIGVLATLPTTLGPTVRFVNTKAIAKRKKVKVCEGLAKGAFEALLSGDSKRHDGSHGKKSGRGQRQNRAFQPAVGGVGSQRYDSTHAVTALWIKVKKEKALLCSLESVRGLSPGR